MKITVTKKGIKSIENTARETLRFPIERKWESADKDERFRSLFGAPSVVISVLWEFIRSQVNYGVEEKHLLLCLVFLKVYAKNEETHCAIVGFPTKQDFQEKSWHIINIFADLTGFKL